MAMPEKIALSQQHTTRMHQAQWLMMLPKMQQALHVLQLPAQELKPLLEAVLEQNVLMEREEGPKEEENLEENDLFPEEEELFLPEEPLNFIGQNTLCLKETDEEGDIENLYTHPYLHKEAAFSQKYLNFLEQSIPVQLSLFEYLMQQAREVFHCEEELKGAEALIGNLEEDGFFRIALSEVAFLTRIPEERLLPILQKIQTFEPHGVGARSFQESLLIQLHAKGKEDSMAARLVQFYYEDLLHNRMPLIRKKLKCSLEEINKAISQDLAVLHLHPASHFFCYSMIPVIPDAEIFAEGEKIEVHTNVKIIPHFRWNLRYLKLLQASETQKMDRDFIQKNLMDAQWIFQSVRQRNATLHKILSFLVYCQRDFFLYPEGKLVPLTMMSVAERVDLHESTVARAVVNKSVSTEKGIFPLRYFFSSGVGSEKKRSSSKEVQRVLKELIQKEDKYHPYTDAFLVLLLKDRGIPCARRTVAKYRSILEIGRASQRRKFK
jgi:RNA polymerase sigma-54 factor